MGRALAIVAAFSRDLTDGFQPAGPTGQSLLSNVTHPRPAFIQRDPPKPPSAPSTNDTQWWWSPSKRRDKSYPKRKNIKGRGSWEQVPLCSRTDALLDAHRRHLAETGRRRLLLPSGATTKCWGMLPAGLNLTCMPFLLMANFEFSHPLNLIGEDGARGGALPAEPHTLKVSMGV